MSRTLQPYQHPYTQQFEPVAPPAPTPVPGPSALTRALPAIVSSAACALGYVHHGQGAAHSIGDAAITGLISLGCLWAGYTMSGATARFIPPSGIAAAYGLGGGLAGVAVIGYANSPVIGLIAWLAGTVIGYALASTGWTRRQEKREARAHERDLAIIHENAETQRAQIDADARMGVAKELGAAWAAEQAASAAERQRTAEFRQLYPSSVPVFGTARPVLAPLAATRPAIDTRVIEQVAGPGGAYDQLTDGIDLPRWLTDPDDPDTAQ